MALGITNILASGNTTSATFIAFQSPQNFNEYSAAVLAIVTDNSTGGGSGPIPTATDSIGNTWTRRQGAVRDPGSANAGLVLSIFETSQNVGIIQSDTIISVSFGSISVPIKSYTLSEITADASNYPSYSTGAAAAGASAGTAPTITTSSLTSGWLVFAAIGNEYGTEQTYTADTDTTNGTWSTEQIAEYGSTTGGQGCISQAKPLTGTGTQTYNVTLGSSADWAAGWIVFEPLAKPTPTPTATPTPTTTPTPTPTPTTTPTPTATLPPSAPKYFAIFLD